MKLSLSNRAVLFAIYIKLKKYFDAKSGESELPPGTDIDVSGASVTITVPEGRVSRGVGPNGDGVIEKKATTSLYGYATWAKFLRRLALFNQKEVVLAMIKEAWTEAVESNATVEEELRKVCPELDTLMEDLKNRPAPKRKESTPRQYSASNESELLCSFDESLRKAA